MAAAASITGPVREFGRDPLPTRGEVIRYRFKAPPILGPSALNVGSSTAFPTSSSQSGKVHHAIVLHAGDEGPTAYLNLYTIHSFTAAMTIRGAAVAGPATIERIREVYGDSEANKYIPVPFASPTSASTLASTTPQGFMDLAGENTFGASLGPGGVVDMGAYVSGKRAWISSEKVYFEELRRGERWESFIGNPRVPEETLRRLATWGVQTSQEPESIREHDTFSSTGSGRMFLPSAVLEAERQTIVEQSITRVKQWLEQQV